MQNEKPCESYDLNTSARKIECNDVGTCNYINKIRKNIRQSFPRYKQINEGGRNFIM